MSEYLTEHLAPNRYFDKNFNMNAVKILPGEYFATQENTLIVTVLGSCISVCLRDPILRVAGMNHFLLPANNDDASVDTDSARYGVYAMEVLINHMLKLGSPKRRLEAKIFGGGNVMQQFRTHSVGEKNAAFITEYMQTEDIKVTATDVLGEYPRKIYFFPESGEVKVRKLKSMHNTTIIDRESAYRSKIDKQPASGDVDLF
ncbi:chemoreceptor glutamine deamidase CheD [Agaribacter marinus]|uniref:Probable chemoreceptor glutamine deamidase CheD n=1 Tax=Agaribacter marinus TaxID=1431249 RepID=A0AA37WKZ8_9ALTE|nr:chemoreceptor glutamine deamidase CheD [Agaribacter marinus]GLR71480.1 putative chemoreceptor glutamine deamidase CheD 1 [Agaribacter marinus]